MQPFIVFKAFSIA